MSITTKRVYERRSPGDGYRVLVDRLWPRGLRREAAEADLWLRDIAPSTALRMWYRHDVERWPEFRERYLAELASHGELLDLILDLEAHHGDVTLLFAARDDEHNEAQVLAEVLKDLPRHAHH